MRIGSSKAFLIYVAALLLTYAAAILWPVAPFLAFATQMTVGFGAYVTKRHFDKKLPAPTEGGHE